MGTNHNTGYDLLSLFIKTYYNELCDENTSSERLSEWVKFFTSLNYRKLCGADYDGKTLLDTINRMACNRDFKPIV